MADPVDATFATLASIPNLAVFVLDTEGCVRYANDEVARMAGFPPEAAIGRSLAQMAPVTGPLIWSAASDAFASRQPVRGSPLTIDWGTIAFDAFPVLRDEQADRVLVVCRDAGNRDGRNVDELAQSRQLLVHVLGRLARMGPDDCEVVISETVAEVALHLDIDRAIVRMLTPDGKRFVVTHRFDAPGIPMATSDDDNAARHAELLAHYAAGETLTFASLDDIPEEHAPVRDRMRAIGCHSACGVPITDGATLLGRLAFLCTREREWTEAVTARLRIYGEMLGTALSRARGEEALRERLRIEEALATLSTHLIDVSPSSLDAELSGALRAIAEALRMDRAVVGMLDDPRTRFVLTHEWCAPGVESYRHALTGLPVAEFGWPLTEVLRNQVTIAVRDDLPASATYIAEVMDRAHARAIVHVPMSVNGETIGLVAFHSLHEAGRISDDLIARLRVVADVIAGALARRRAAESLSESESRFTQAIETALDGVVILEPNGVILEWTPQSERLFGRRRHEVVGRRFVDVAIDPKERDVFHLDAASPTAGRLELSGVHRDRRVFPIELSYAPMKRGGAEIFALFVRDITDRRRAEQERQRAFDEVSRQKANAERERDYLREELATDGGQAAILGSSPTMLRALESLDAVAATSAAVLIHGESGVGKELFARAVHTRSKRASAPLVKVNCASIPESLFESEFFGHVRGSFTGAHKDRVGRFELADGGTLFLDEVGEIPLDMQAKLLRVLQEGEFERVGDDRTRKVDVRIVAATNRDLGTEALAARFRRDLYYRLSVFPIEVPPLRDRPEDIVPLAQSFLRTIARNAGRAGLELSEEQKTMLIDYDWPGNVRELEHVIERAVILSPRPPLQLTLALAGPQGQSSSQTSPRARVSEGAILTDDELRKLERDNLVSALDKAKGRVSGDGGAAELLKVNPSTLRDRMKALGVARRA